MNYQFMILKAIAIVLVVLGHSGGISILTDWFPTDSFHMPLFIFMSGYFYKTNNEDNIILYIKKNFKKLIIPLFIWNIFYGTIITLLLNNDIVYYGRKIGFYSLFISPWTEGNQFGLNNSSWFITTLFLIKIIYIILKKIFKIIYIKNEYIITMIFVMIGLIGVHMSNIGYNKDFGLLAIRIMFLIQFYQIGYLYKIKLESNDKVSNIAYFLVIFLI